jgi:hypothetical protein
MKIFNPIAHGIQLSKQELETIKQVSVNPFSAERMEERRASGKGRKKEPFYLIER